MSRLASKFADRHIGPSREDTLKMLKTVNVKNMDELVKNIVPSDILLNRQLKIPPELSESEALRDAENMSNMNRVGRSFIGMGYHNCDIPTPIIRNVLENPGWYTAYTPYQAEISQGRLEALFIYQTAVSDLTGLPISNASLLDEGTAVAEAMGMAYRITKRKRFLIDSQIHPQTLSVIKTRAKLLGWEVKECSLAHQDAFDEAAAVVFQYPNTLGHVVDYSSVVAQAKERKIMSICATDLLALALIRPPGDFGVDIAVGSSQRLGQPIGFGGPHAAFISSRREHVRNIPGRIVGRTITNDGEEAYRLALQTREQHIRRQSATSNICTAQALLANMCGFYCVYHGREGLEAKARMANSNANYLKTQLSKNGYNVLYDDYFDTIAVQVSERIGEKAKSMNLRVVEPNKVVISLDETLTDEDMASLCQVFEVEFEANVWENTPHLTNHKRQSDFLIHSVFKNHRSETEFMRFVKRLENKDISLVHSMITLGSCTMKLNSATSLAPLSWAGFGSLHPYLPSDQTKGYTQVVQQLHQYLCEITGFDSISFQPNSGAQGEFAGLIAIVRYLESIGQGQRRICLIPTSAHGTNPATAAMAGLDVKQLDMDCKGGVNVDQLADICAKHRDEIACLMITYPSTCGVFDSSIVKICDMVHSVGGQIYLDGANMNAQVGICRPADYGIDVCHLNLHKTFAIPHGGGGPGAGPIGVRAHLTPFLPADPLAQGSGHSVSSANYGSASILLVSLLYVKMMGPNGLLDATKTALLNANYLRARLEPHYKVLYSNEHGFCAHEFLIDLEDLTKSAQIEPADVAKRLMDYGFHAPTMSFPRKSVLMIEPTESESLAELDRFCEAMISIRGEIAEIESGRMDKKCNPLKMSPHTARTVCSSQWDRPYSRETAAFPSGLVIPASKVWPAVGRVNDVHGDRNLICTLND